MTDSTSTSPGPIRVDVFIRPHASAAVVERVRELVARARRLEATGAVADVRVKTWASVRPALEELSDTGPSVALTVMSFQAWADREGYTLRPAFVRRETTSVLSRRPVAEIQVPIACVAVYDDDRLRWVAPCADGERTYAVADCLTTLETGTLDSLPGRSPSREGLEPFSEDP